jgi:succinate dehydrogenase / fumarate reductase flavoprotein subunit
MLKFGTDKGFNQRLEKATRVADFLELGGCLLKMLYTVTNLVEVTLEERYQTEDGETKSDENFAYVAWELQRVN